MDEYKNRLLLNAIILAICSGISLYTLYDLSYSWPTQGCFGWFILIFLAPFFIYQLLAIGHFLIHQNLLTQKFTTSLLSLFFGFLLAGAALQYTQNNALQRFIRAYAPMIQHIKHNMPTPCDQYYFKLPSVQHYNTKTARMIVQNGNPIGMLRHNSREFLLHFQGGSIDIEGSTLYYDSTTERWHFFHNNNLPEKAIFNQRHLALAKCHSLN
jgi:hypothetical protein